MHCKIKPLRENVGAFFMGVSYRLYKEFKGAFTNQKEPVTQYRNCIVQAPLSVPCRDLLADMSGQANRGTG